MSESDTMFNERDRRCAAVQLMLSTDPSYDNRTIANTLKIQIWMVQRAQGDENKVSGFGYGSWCGFKWGPHHATSHLRSQLESQHQVYLDVLKSDTMMKSVVIPWCNQVTGGRPWVWQQDLTPAHKSKETKTCLQKECYDFVPFSHWPSLIPRPEPAGLLCLVIHQKNHQHDLPQHQSQPDRRYPPSIRWAPAGACGKGMLPVLDPYRGGYWGWKRLHWINISSTT